MPKVMFAGKIGIERAESQSERGICAEPDENRAIATHNIPMTG